MASRPRDSFAAMTDAAQQTPPADTGSAPPAGGSPPAGDTQQQTQTASRPDWLPEPYWDAKAGALNTDEFGKHYGEVASNAAKYAERIAAVPPKPEDYKAELKLPDGVKLPEGISFDPAKDPRLPLITKLAHERGWTQDDMNALVAFDAQMHIADHNAQVARVLAEDKKLGEKAVERRAAVTNWVKALADKKEITADEAAAINAEFMDASAITLVEKLIAKITGGVPGHLTGDPPRQQQAPRLLKDILYPQEKAS